MKFCEPPLQRDQLVLFQEKVDDSLPPDHPVRFLWLILTSDSFKPLITQFEEGYKERQRRPPIAPIYLLALYIYGTMQRLRSARDLEAACFNRIDIRWLMSGHMPDHSTIARFITRHTERIDELFKKTVELGVRAKMVNFETFGVDGTVIDANASKNSVRNIETLEQKVARAQAAVIAIRKEWGETERREQALLGNDEPWTPSDTRSHQARLAAAEALLARLETAVQQVERRAQESKMEVVPVNSMTDPDSRTMRRKKGGSGPSYNGQILRDEQSGLITANSLDDSPSDQGKLAAMAKASEENCGQKHKVGTADSGYNTGKDLAELAEAGVEMYLPDSHHRTGAKALSKEVEDALASGRPLTEEEKKSIPFVKKNKQDRFDKLMFKYDEASDEYVCPAGNRLGRQFLNTRDQAHGKVYGVTYGGCSACASCRHAELCYDGKKGRTIFRDEHEKYREDLRARMSTEEGRAIYKKRSHVAETPFAYIKERLGVRQFLRRGLTKVRAEWNLACSVFNFRILMQNMPLLEKVLSTR